MEINQILDAIEARVKLNRPNVTGQAMVMAVDGDLNLNIGFVIDPSKITHALLEDIRRFNDEANPEVLIEFIDGKIINMGADNALFVLTFNATKCNGGL